MIGTDQYELIRTAQQVYGKSIQSIAKQYGHSRRTVQNALAGIERRYLSKKSPAGAGQWGPFGGIFGRQSGDSRAHFFHFFQECGPTNHSTF
jgi:hypothetical protein